MSRRCREPTAGSPGTTSTAGLSHTTAATWASQRNRAIASSARSPAKVGVLGVGDRGRLRRGRGRRPTQPVRRQRMSPGSSGVPWWSSTACSSSAVISRRASSGRRGGPAAAAQPADVEQHAAADDPVLGPVLDPEVVGVARGVRRAAAPEAVLAAPRTWPEGVPLRRSLEVEVVEAVVHLVAVEGEDLVAVRLAAEQRRVGQVEGEVERQRPRPSGRGPRQPGRGRRRGG